jgi:hypothetical protein
MSNRNLQPEGMRKIPENVPAAGTPKKTGKRAASQKRRKLAGDDRLLVVAVVAAAAAAAQLADDLQERR